MPAGALLVLACNGGGLSASRPDRVRPAPGYPSSPAVSASHVSGQDGEAQRAAAILALADAAMVSPPADAAASVARADSAADGSSSGPDDRAKSGSTDDMLLVPAGPFTMGADSGGQPDEHPAHQVTVAAYWLDRTEVSNRAYDLCVGAGVCRPHDAKSATLNRFGGDGPFRRPDQPISAISWDDARAYCRFVGKRLPSEAEWEKAARGTDGRKYPWGDTAPSRELAVFATDATSEVGTHAKGAGPYGHLDLAGNVWEWVEDIYDPYAYRREGASRGVAGTCEQVLAAQDELRAHRMQGFTGTNPIPSECERVLRGGAFNYDGPGLRASNRVHHPARFRLVMSGFRCAKDG